MTSDRERHADPGRRADGLDDSEPLEQPIEEEFRAGTMTLSWDPDDERVVIEVFPLHRGGRGQPRAADEESRSPSRTEVFLVRLDAGRAAGVREAGRAGDRGRPADCPFCGNPIDPEGHLCVRANGFRRRDPLRVRERCDQSLLDR